MKDTDSASWFINLRDALYKFELQLLANPPEKLQWKRTVKAAVHEYCRKRVQQDIPLYTSLRYLKETDYTPGLCHSTLNIKGDPIRETQRLSVKLRLLTAHVFCNQRK